MRAIPGWVLALALTMIALAITATPALATTDRAD
jgi:hypothetical protein